MHIRERSLSVVNLFLDEMAKEAKNIITTICDEQCNLSDRLLPKHCAALIAQVSLETEATIVKIDRPRFTVGCEQEETRWQGFGQSQAAATTAAPTAAIALSTGTARYN